MNIEHDIQYRVARRSTAVRRAIRAQVLIATPNCPECHRGIDGIRRFKRSYDGVIVNVCTRCGAEWVTR